MRKSRTRPATEYAIPCGRCTPALPKAIPASVAAHDRPSRASEAREGLSWAATLAGIAFGNAGVHLPHGMAYSVAGLVRDFRMPGYPREEPMVPHGVSVVVSAPAAFRFTESA